MSQAKAVKTDHSVARSMALYRKAEQLIPGVAQLISRRPTRRAFGVSPVYGARAKGCRIWDIDGNEYVDWMSAVGPIILGYADEVVDRAVKEQIDRGSIYSLLTEASVELAELLVRLIPSAEMVRYAKGGGEACAVAVRIARGVTGRDRVLFCGYHGWHDWYQSANLGNEKLQQHLFSGIEPTGIPRVLEGTAVPFEYGDNNMLEDLLEEHEGEVACIIMEPMRSEMPPEGYLEGVRDLATRHGVILIFDEVSCGFRVALGGAQELTGVTPDMTALAKGISNGYPMGAVVGKREVMAPAAQMFISSAYWDDNVGIVAALTTFEGARAPGRGEPLRAGRDFAQGADQPGGAGNGAGRGVLRRTGTPRLAVQFRRWRDGQEDTDPVRAGDGEARGDHGKFSQLRAR